MTIDFTVLPMTELRNTPGEILDRVADAGEAFVIERNGKQKACLVPLSIFFPDIPPARMAREMDELAAQGEAPRTSFSQDREISLSFPVNNNDAGDARITVLLPHGYPNSCPKVYANPVADNAPHRWNDGALCLYGVMTGWNPGKHTVFSTLQLARQWFANYSAWQNSGQWPSGPEASNNA